MLDVMAAISVEFEDAYENKMYLRSTVDCNGLLEGVGETLIQHYNEEALALQLVRLGRLLRVGKVFYVGHRPSAFPPGIHEDVTIAHHRDLDAQWSANDYQTLNGAKMVAEVRQGYIDYEYIFRQGEWYVALPGDPQTPFSAIVGQRRMMPLGRALAEVMA